MRYLTNYVRLASLSSRLRLGAKLAFSLLLVAYALQYLFGYQPCVLCLQQRALWWLLLLLCTLSQLFVQFSSGRFSSGRFFGQLPSLRRALYLSSQIALLVMLASLSLSLYHAGGERGLWSLTLLCEGFALKPDASIEELRELLLARDVVSCEQVSLRLLGLSLAEYNAIFSLLLALLFADGLWRAGRAGRVS